MLKNIESGRLKNRWVDIEQSNIKWASVFEHNIGDRDKGVSSVKMLPYFIDLIYSRG